MLRTLISAKVEVYDAADHLMVTNTSKSAGRVNNTEQGPHYSCAFPIKTGSYTSSSTWNFGAWSPTPVSGTSPHHAKITLTDDYGSTYVGDLPALSTATATWAELFPVFNYTAGAGGTITGNLSQTVTWSELGATGTTVTAVAENGYHFTGWGDGVLTAARTDIVPTDAVIPSYSGISVTANFVKTEIVVTPENFNTNKSIAYYGVTTGWMLSGADASHVISAKVEVYDAADHLMVTNTSKSAGRVNNTEQGPHYSCAFPIKTGSYTSSSTWNFGAWSPTPVSGTSPHHAKITLTDDYGSTYVGDLPALSTATATWAELFPLFTYTAGTGGTLTGTSSQRVAWFGSGATGTVVTAVTNSGNSFTGWSDGVLTAARTDVVPTDALIPTYSGVTVTANFETLKTISGTITHAGLLAGGTTIMFDTAGTDYPGTINLSTGIYNITGIPKGTVGDIVPAYFGGGGYNFAPTSIPGITITGDLPGQNFTATGARTISGTITGPGGARLPEGTVVDFGNGMTFTQGAGATTGFSFTGVAPKNYRMGLMNITYPGSLPFRNNRLYLAVSPMPTTPPASAPIFNFATTVFGDDTIGNDLMYFWTPFTLSGTIKTPLGANPVLKAFNISLVGTGNFAGQNLKGTYNASNSTFTINTPFTKIGSTITPAAFTGNLLITGYRLSDLHPAG